MSKLKGKKLKVLRKLKANFPLKLKVSEVFLHIFSKTQGTGGFWGYQRGLESKNRLWKTYTYSWKGIFRAILIKLKGSLRKTQYSFKKLNIYQKLNEFFLKTQRNKQKNSRYRRFWPPASPWKSSKKKACLILSIPFHAFLDIYIVYTIIQCCPLQMCFIGSL